MSFAKTLYHRLVPASVRNPIGMLRRKAIDRLTRATSAALPPVELLANVQMTPFVREYLEVGERSAASIRRYFEESGIAPTAVRAVLDFGCGSARTLRHLTDTRWTLSGCDVDDAAISWASNHLQGIEFKRSGERPPLPWDDASFDAAFAVSVFTHFSPAEQRDWIAELARVLKPSGVLIITTMGPSVIANFPHGTPENIAALEESGTIFIPSAESFNARAAFHTVGGVAAIARPHFELTRWIERGLDGFQDLAILVKMPRRP